MRTKIASSFNYWIRTARAILKNFFSPFCWLFFKNWSQKRSTFFAFHNRERERTLGGEKIINSKKLRVNKIPLYWSSPTWLCVCECLWFRAGQGTLLKAGSSQFLELSSWSFFRSCALTQDLDTVEKTSNLVAQTKKEHNSPLNHRHHSHHHQADKIARCHFGFIRILSR